MNKMKISVVVPSYNAENYIAETLRSIQRQLVEPFEVIVVDDCSTDNTVQTVKNVGWHKIRVLRNKKNMGIGFTRQRGAEVAKGEYVAFLSADDVYDPLFLSVSTRYLDENTATFTEYLKCDSNLKPFKTFHPPKFWNNAEFRGLVIKWALEKNVFVNFSSVIFPRKIFEQVKFETSLRHGEDLIFLLDSIIYGLKYCLIEKPLLLYRIHEAMGTRQIRGNKEEFVMLWLFLEERLIRLGVPLSRIRKSYKKSYDYVFIPHKRIIIRGQKLIKKAIYPICGTVESFFSFFVWLLILLLTDK